MNSTQPTCTALEYAVKLEMVEVVELVLGKGVDPDHGLSVRRIAVPGTVFAQLLLRSNILVTATST